MSAGQQRVRSQPSPRIVPNVIWVGDEAGGGSVAHTAAQVYLNGVPLLLTEHDGFSIDYGPKEATVVTLRVIASEVRFGGDDPYALPSASAGDSSH